MYRTKYPRVDDHGESPAVDAIGDDVVVIIGNEQRPEVDGSQRQELTAATSSGTQDRKTQQYSSTQTFQRDEEEEDEEQEEEEREEEPNDNVIVHFTRFSPV